MYKTNKNIKCFTVNDNGKTILIKQPKFKDLTSLYLVLLNNLTKINKTYLD